jgi:hypothetical protein
MSFWKKLFGGSKATTVALPAPPATSPKGSQPGITQSDRRGGGASAILALTCTKCGKSYNLGQDAVAVAPEVALRALGIPTVGDMAGEPDLVSVLDAGSDVRGALERAKPHLEFIADAIAKGQGRRWTCKACNTTQSYPAIAAMASQRPSVAPTSELSPASPKTTPCEHKWDGCKCSLCGEVRNQDGLLRNDWHNFVNDQCTKCGKQRRRMTVEYR